MIVLRNLEKSEGHKAVIVGGFVEIAMKHIVCPDEGEYEAVRVRAERAE